MTEEKTKAEREEAERLIAQINHLKGQTERALIENRNPQNELVTLVENVYELAQRVAAMDIEMDQSMVYVQKRVKEVDISTLELFALIDDLTNSYFVFKNLSMAIKNVTQSMNEYSTEFKFCHELRRTSLGYVVSLDAHICSDETMRKKVESICLQNTEYWLVYMSMAVMLWANNEEEVVRKAMTKALSKDYFSSALYFLLVNLRFTRVDVAKKWCLCYPDRVDMENLGDEWQYLLQAYLSGVLGVDKGFHYLIHQCSTDLLTQMESMHPRYGSQVIDKTMVYSNSYIHVTDYESETLRRHYTEYEELKNLLPQAEKNEVLAMHFRKVWGDRIKPESDLFQRIKNIPHSLIGAHDKEEFEVIKNRRYNEMIITVKGDLNRAQQSSNIEYPVEKMTRSLDNLLLQWASKENDDRVDVSVKKFAIFYLKKWTIKGFMQYGETYRREGKEKHEISIDGWLGACNENPYEDTRNESENCYNNSRILDTLKDKFVLIFTGMVPSALVVLVITILHFNKIPLVIGIFLGVVDGFLLRRGIADMQSTLRARRENGCLLLKTALDELKERRESYKAEDAKNSDLAQVFENIES